MDGPEAKAQPSMATPTEEDTYPKVLIRGEWRKVPNGCPRDASGATTPLEGKETSAEQSVDGLEAKAQPSMATPTEEDTYPKVLIRGEWRKVPDGCPRDASGVTSFSSMS